jgi:hypothetical protein
MRFKIRCSAANCDLSRYRRPTGAAFAAGAPRDRRQVVDGTIFNSRGVRVGMVLGPSIFDPSGQRIYDLKGTNVYKLSGELVGHLPLDARNSKRRLDKSTDKLFR